VLTVLPDILHVTNPGGPEHVVSPLGDQLLDTIPPGSEEAFWNSTSASSPMFEGDNTYTIQGAQFSIGTYIFYCSPTSGARILSGGSEIIVGTTINASN
jgi:hypothetical protein